VWQGCRVPGPELLQASYTQADVPKMQNVWAGMREKK
jgi:hypothetical protein